MMANWLKVLLFVVGGTTAAGGIAYVTGALDPWVEPETPVLASLPDPTAAPSSAESVADIVDEGDAERPQQSELPTEEYDATEASVVDEAVDIVVPGFDVVRVEPDGSMVIAGHAAPDAVVEVVTGTRVIATVQAGPDGDFAAVLEEPLSPGDYQIVLRSTTEDNVVATSIETAVVSIPDAPDGQVLALVEQPGEPSRLITVPEATLTEPIEEPGAAETEMAEAEAAVGDETLAMAADEADTQLESELAESDAAREPDETVSAELLPEEEPTELAVGEAEALPEQPDMAAVPADEAATAEEPEVAEVPSEADELPSETAMAEVDEPEALPEQPDMAAVPADEAATAEEPEVAEVPSEADELSSETDMAEVDEPETLLEEDEATAEVAVEADAEQDIAALPQPEQPAAAPPAASPSVRVFVEAVEIDGGTVFVAGMAEAGRYVRVYANEILLGETRASEGDRFLIEADVNLPVGDYIIRADLLDTDGSVLARAAVPFEREPGEAVAAVAPLAPRPAAESAEEVAEADEALGDLEIAEEAVVEEPAGETAMAESAEEATPEPDTALVDEAVMEPELDVAMADEADESIADEAGETVASEEAVPADEMDVAIAPEPFAAPEDTLAAPEGEAMTEEADVASATEAVESPDETELLAEAADEPRASEASEIEAVTDLADSMTEPETPSEEFAAADPAETLSPALERVDGAVIIRRGDNLWRISRRVYGRGIRYSTIYLANQDQIRNPDLIWPGQVFTVPAETSEGEQADLEALADQAVDPSEVPGEIIR